MTAHSRLPLRPSLYADTAIAPTPTPPLVEDKSVAVAIVGGGFTGLSTALHLAEQGVDVTVLEAQQPGWGASGNNGGQANPGLKHDPDRIEADFGADLGGRMIAFGYGTTDYTFDLIRRYQIPCEARQNGTLRAAYNDASAAGIEATARQCIQRGMPVTLLNRDQVREITGTDRYLCAMLDDELTVTVAVKERRAASILFGQTIARADGACLVRANVRVACVDTRRMRAVAIPADLILEPSP